MCWPVIAAVLRVRRPMPAGRRPMQARAGVSVAVIVYCQPFGSWTFDITVP